MLIYQVFKGETYYPSKGAAGDFLRAFKSETEALLFAKGAAAVMDTLSWCRVEVFDADTLTYIKIFPEVGE